MNYYFSYFPSYLAHGTSKQIKEFNAICFADVEKGIHATTQINNLMPNGFQGSKNHFHTTMELSYLMLNVMQVLKNSMSNGL